jgi:hypothetical protein
MDGVGVKRRDSREVTATEQNSAAAKMAAALVKQGRS